jgi:CHAT domain-containing protein
MGQQSILATLPNLEREAADVAAVLNAARVTGPGNRPVEPVRVSELLAAGKDPLAHVLDMLRHTEWHLIHFVGHAIQSNDRAALVLSADRNILLPVDTFSKHILAAQFVFLSCCRSAHSSLIMRMAEQSVPAILGFRWRVDDAGAARFAHAFYTELFNTDNPRCKYLEYAFRDARKAVYDTDDDDPTWASPMLVLQMKQAEAAG